MQLRGVRARLGRTTIPGHVSFDVPAGSITGILGHNGAGKTASMRGAGWPRVVTFPGLQEKWSGKRSQGPQCFDFA
jgi:ABC-type transport system involved in cytochrome c biogenesis ATPase subunit